MVYNVLVCDDDPQLEHQRAEEIRQVTPENLYNVIEGRQPTRNSSENRQLSFHQSINELLARRKNKRSETPQRESQECLFDNQDILVLDYDLIQIDEEKTPITGEGLARLARFFSTCGVIVVYNQFRDIHFDLSLRGHLWSYADLNIHADLLKTPGLWSDQSADGFRPWSWQILKDAVETNRERQLFVSEHFEMPIVDVIGMQEDDILRLADTTFSFLWPQAQSLSEMREITFQRYLDSVATDLDAVAAGTSDQQAARIVSARVGKWLERDVLGGQDVLIDIPHLIERFPFLLGHDYKKLDAWNAAISGDKKLHERIPSDCWFKATQLLSRPAIWLQRFQKDETIAELRHNFDYTKVPSFVFLEDVSQFVPIGDAMEFRAGHHNPYDTRFVQRVRNLNYAPLRRFALGEELSV